MATRSPEAGRAFAKGVKLLMHEVYLTDSEVKADEVERSRHSYPSAVAKLARDAGVGTLMPVHHNPRRPDDEMRKLIQEIQDLAGMDVWLPEEGRIYEVNGSTSPVRPCEAPPLKTGSRFTQPSPIQMKSASREVSLPFSSTTDETKAITAILISGCFF